MFWQQCVEDEDGWAGKCCACLSHDHTIITTRLQNNHLWEPPTWRLGGRRHIEAGRGLESKTDWFPPMCGGWESTGISQLQGFHWGLRGHMLTPGSPAWTTSARKSLHNMWLWKSAGILFRWDRGCYRPLKGVILKDPCTDLLPDELTCSKLQYWCSSSKRAKDIWGGTELFGFRARNEGPALFQAEVLAPTTVPLLRHTHSKQAQVGAISGLHQFG